MTSGIHIGKLCCAGCRKTPTCHGEPAPPQHNPVRNISPPAPAHVGRAAVNRTSVPNLAGRAFDLLRLVAAEQAAHVLEGGWWRWTRRRPRPA